MVTLSLIILTALFALYLYDRRKKMTELERLEEVLATVSEGVTAIATVVEELPELLADLKAGDPAAVQARFEKMAEIADKAKALPGMADIIRLHVADAKAAPDAQDGGGNGDGPPGDDGGF